MTTTEVVGTVAKQLEAGERLRVVHEPTIDPANGQRTWDTVGIHHRGTLPEGLRKGMPQGMLDGIAYGVFTRRVQRQKDDVVAVAVERVGGGKAEMGLHIEPALQTGSVDPGLARTAITEVMWEAGVETAHLGELAGEIPLDFAEAVGFQPAEDGGLIFDRNMAMAA